MRVRVDEQRCQGHNLCSIAAPSIFLLRDDDGHAYVTDEAVPAGMEQRVLAAEASCPERAIETDETDETGLNGADE
jgi:ferredoxin